jgi:hypothetical protein
MACHLEGNGKGATEWAGQIKIQSGCTNISILGGLYRNDDEYNSTSVYYYLVNAEAAFMVSHVLFDEHTLAEVSYNDFDVYHVGEYQQMRTRYSAAYQEPQSQIGWAENTYTDTDRPTATLVPDGFQIFNTTSGMPEWSDGTNWIDATGTTT